MTDVTSTAPSLRFTLQTSKPVSSLALGSSGALYVGSDDGSMRVYGLPSQKVKKAIRGLGEDVSSIVTRQRKDGNVQTMVEDIWIAAGTKAYLFSMDSPKFILSVDDATAVLTLGEDEDDVLNELSIHHNGKHLAFASDGGTVGVVDLSTHGITRMRNSHGNICGTVKFIPDRPSELVSGGYDHALFHHDFSQGNLLSRYDISSAPPSSGVSLSPPFILCTSTSATGIISAGTADGRLWVGTGGEKRIDRKKDKKKRSRKWEGLKEESSLWIKVAEGPIVASTCVAPSSFLSCTLLGTISHHTLIRDDKDNPEKVNSHVSWCKDSASLEKVNAMTADEQWIAVGGFGKSGQGLVEIWDMKSGGSS